MRLLAIFLFVATASWAQASPEQSPCNFMEREKFGAFFPNLPAEVIGWLNCEKVSPELNSIFVAKLKASDASKVETFVSEFARITDGDALEAHVTLKKHSKASRVYEVISQNNVSASKPMLHSALAELDADGMIYLFIHSAEVKTAQLERASLNRVFDHLQRRPSAAPTQKPSSR